MLRIFTDATWKPGWNWAGQLRDGRQRWRYVWPREV